MTIENDKRFRGSIAELYEKYMVPLIFEPYAHDLAARVASQSDSFTRVLEVAAGTGVATRSLASSLPSNISIVASDLNPPMLEMAKSIGTSRPVEWQQADVMQLPFEDESFDAVVCQFGTMFFPDKPHAFAETRRVLKKGGMLFFSVWARIEENEFADVITTVLAELFPDAPPRFLARTPHGYCDHDVIRRDLAGGGFAAEASITTVDARSRATSAYVPALAYCQGTPLLNEIEQRDATRVVEATDAATRALTERFGPGPVDGKIQAHVITCRA